MCQGKMPLSVRERYVKMREQPNRMADLDSRIENFDRALSHPNAEDLENLKKNVLQKKTVDPTDSSVKSER